MFHIWKMLFPTLFLSFADQIDGGGDSDEQPDDQTDGNDEEKDGASDDQTPTDVELEGGVKVSQATLDKWARGAYKDRFEAYDNREKWQAENTRKAQETAQDKRDAESFRRLQSDPNFGKPKTDTSYEGQKRAYVEKAKSAFPEVDPRFFEFNFDQNWEMSGKRANESTDPIRQQQAQEWERNFLSAHPLVKAGTPQYDELARRLGKGYDPEEAYQIVYSKDIEEKKFQDRLKARDEEAKRKLKANRTQSSSSGRTGGKTSFDDSFDKSWAKHGGGGE